MLSEIEVSYIDVASPEVVEEGFTAPVPNPAGSSPVGVLPRSNQIYTHVHWEVGVGIDGDLVQG